MSLSDNLGKSFNNLKIIFFIIIQIIVFLFYIYIGKYDWDYATDLPFRALFFSIFLLITGIIFGSFSYILGYRSTKYKDDKILKVPLFLIFLSIILLFIMDIIGVIKICFYNLIFIFAVFNSKIENRTKYYKISKIVFGLKLMYLIIPVFAICFGIYIELFLKSFTHYNNPDYYILFIIYIFNTIFGYNLSKYYDDIEIKYFKIILIINYLITAFIFLIFGFNWYKEDYQGIIFTFPYKVMVYVRTYIFEKNEIIKTLASRDFCYIMGSYIFVLFGYIFKKSIKKKSI